MPDISFSQIRPVLGAWRSVDSPRLHEFEEAFDVTHNRQLDDVSF